MKQAIAVTPVWNHLLGVLIQPGEIFEMLAYQIDSLIEIGAAEEVPAPAPKK